MIYKKASENLSQFLKVVESITAWASSDAFLLDTIKLSVDDLGSKLEEGVVTNFFKALHSTLQVAIAALDWAHEVKNPKPIPLEELKMMIGEPVWVEYRVLNHSGWSILSETTFCTLGGYGEACVAYRYKPKKSEVHTDES